VLNACLSRVGEIYFFWFFGQKDRLELKVQARNCMREEEQVDQEAVVEEVTRNTMSFDSHDLPPDLEELDPVEKPSFHPGNLPRGCVSTVSVISS
jgi:hypothetical protein